MSELLQQESRYSELVFMQWVQRTAFIYDDQQFAYSLGGIMTPVRKAVTREQQGSHQTQICGAHFRCVRRICERHRIANSARGTEESKHSQIVRRAAARQCENPRKVQRRDISTKLCQNLRPLGVFDA